MYMYTKNNRLHMRLRARPNGLGRTSICIQAFDWGAHGLALVSKGLAQKTLDTKTGTLGAYKLEQN